MFRVGHGYDVHPFQENKILVLGGVKIDYPKGMRAHSDGDVVLHAICDALLGAAALGDIGQHFSDLDAKWADVDSRILLQEVFAMLQNANFQINNIDVTIVAQVPKLFPYILKMRENIASDLKINLSQMNIKATTTEKMGFIGREEGIAVYAIALIASV